MKSLTGCCVLFFALMATRALPAAEQSREQWREDRHFTLKVLPLLKGKCLGCHGGDESDIKGEYDVAHP